MKPELEAATDKRTSRLPGFYRLSAESRREAVARWAGLTSDETAALHRGITPSLADAMIENVVGIHALPLGFATNFQVNGRDVLVPMAIEEPSVVAAASHAALMARRGGGFDAEADDSIMIGQIQLVDLPDADVNAAIERIQADRDRVLALARAQDEVLLRLGGGPKDLELRPFPQTASGPMLVVHLICDTLDAMGANSVNTACEAIAPLIESLTGGRVVLRIISNLADRRLARSRCRIPAVALAREGLPGDVVAARIVAANALALADPYRAATHNKGIMNGIDPVVVATGNDWRAIEAGAHAYAARDGAYRALTGWHVDESGVLIGRLELPLALGAVGGATRAHPTAGVALKILGVTSARELAEIVVCVGLAQNLAALRALVSEGIQSGHMSLHARQLAIAAGADAEEAVRIAEQMVAEGRITTERAEELAAARRT